MSDRSHSAEDGTEVVVNGGNSDEVQFRQFNDRSELSLYRLIEAEKYFTPHEPFDIIHVQKRMIFSFDRKVAYV